GPWNGDFTNAHCDPGVTAILPSRQGPGSVLGCPAYPVGGRTHGAARSAATSIAEIDARWQSDSRLAKARGHTPSRLPSGLAPESSKFMVSLPGIARGRAAAHRRR